MRTETSKTTLVTADTTSPVLAINEPNDPSYGRYTKFNISISETVKILEYYDLNEISPRWRRLCSNCDGYGDDRNRRVAFVRGVHNLTIRAKDYAGNGDEEIRNFVTNY